MTTTQYAEGRLGEQDPEWGIPGRELHQFDPLPALEAVGSSRLSERGSAPPRKAHGRGSWFDPCCLSQYGMAGRPLLASDDNQDEVG